MALLQSLFNSSQPSSSEIVTLTEADIPILRLHLHSRIREHDARQALREMPGLSQWHPKSGEYVLVSPWRHRHEIMSLREVSAFYHETELVAAVLEAAEQKGLRACITAESYERRRPIFYFRNGLELFETIVSYHHSRNADFIDALESPIQQFVAVNLDDAEMMKALVALDSRAFPWLWQNSAGEFAWWMRQPSVEVWAGVIEDQVVSYYGTTLFHQMGHLDRIAVHPDWQGKGLGREILTFAMQRLAQLGLPEAGLSTQMDNEVSRRLYERVGFVRREREDYHMYGTLLSAAPDESEQE